MDPRRFNEFGTSADDSQGTPVVGEITNGPERLPTSEDTLKTDKKRD